MTFEEWFHDQVAADPACVDDYEATKAAWNAALEEAAKAVESIDYYPADHLSLNRGKVLDEIRSLKESI